MSSFQHIIPSTPPLIPQVDQYRVVHHTLYHTTTINKYIIFIIFLYSFIYSATRSLSTCAQLSLTIPYFHSNLFYITALPYNHNPSNIPQVDSLPVADDICSRLPLSKLYNIYTWSEGHVIYSTSRQHSTCGLFHRNRCWYLNYSYILSAHSLKQHKSLLNKS
jgi:hypothetical protein